MDAIGGGTAIHRAERPIGALVGLPPGAPAAAICSRRAFVGPALVPMVERSAQTRRRAHRSTTGRQVAAGTGAAPHVCGPYERADQIDPVSGQARRLVTCPD